ncbi:protein-disulfide reductase DsbD family protein [Primorskyibacter aestuariivivens]|uniref:protein-disulfide reductase DsbD family protein n=1 Tax=Primorskyibacter aestuariivivens TaxID=1888912 RepID=UPI0023019EB3|nr:protein-disulfide reductase DsbD domain-containing protein [Primorskyibacter aestuariivivens]MDA7430344.1 protein-disulfide reductase DsbD family protein [Primorskyibacter aestuariivivens]
MRLLTRIMLVLALVLPVAAWAASSDRYEAHALTARLITVENGVAPGAGSVSAGLVVEMAEGWKTYWRSPGEVGLPPELDWSTSDNVAETEFLYPAPTRFTAFDIENFGYGDQVVFPIRVALDQPGEAATLTTQARLLVCKDICIPEDFTLTLALPQSTGIDAEAASLVAVALAQVPLDAAETDMTLEAAHLSDDALTVALIKPTGFAAPDVFPELGDASFGKPEIRLSGDGTRLWARFPALYLPEDTPDLHLTATDGGFAATLPALLSDAPPPAPARTPDAGLLWTALIAVLGGLILNVMPCVLPVLSIKLMGAMKKAEKGRARVRTGFLLSAAGIISFFWVLAAATYALQSMGHAVGWGLQFQSPVFLTTMIAILLIFAANMAGLFDLALPSALQSRLSVAGGSGHLGDFATGAFAAVLATPCSAPFLGTAVAYAMSGGALEIAVIFTALGVGLALPYLAIALFPGTVAFLPKPGRWMLGLKWLMGALLALTALWLFFVLWGVAGWPLTAIVAGLMALILILLALPRLPARATFVSAVAALAIALPRLSGPAPEAPASATRWAAFSESSISGHVASGKTVFVDVTADWCLTCKANKALVLDRDPIASLLASEGIVAMQADWTRPDPSISAYLERFNRFGIPFNAVYGPAAPNGIALPELLSKDAILTAVNDASGN